MTNGLWYVQAHTPSTHLATCTNQLHLSAFLVLPNKQPRSPFHLKGAACTHHCLCGDVPKEHLSLSLPCYPQIIIKTSNKKMRLPELYFSGSSPALFCTVCCLTPQAMITHSLSLHYLAPGNMGRARRNASLWDGSIPLLGWPGLPRSQFVISIIVASSKQQRPEVTGWWDPSATWYRGNVCSHFQPGNQFSPDNSPCTSPRPFRGVHAHTKLFIFRDR